MFYDEFRLGWTGENNVMLWKIKWTMILFLGRRRSGKLISCVGWQVQGKEPRQSRSKSVETNKHERYADRMK